MAGLAQYSPLFENPLFTQTINEIPVQADYIGSRFLPSQDTFDMDWNETVLTRQADMADIVDGGAELPLTDRDPVRRVSGEITDIGQKYIVTKKELQALMDKGNEARRRVAEAQILGKAGRVKQNLDARLEWMRWQALGSGLLVYNKRGVILSVDFGVPATSKKTAATRWDDTSPTIIVNYETWVQDYIDLNGKAPDVFVTSTLVVRTILNDAAVITAIRGTSGSGIMLTLDELNTFLRGRQMPPIEAFDAKVTYRDVDSGGTRVTQRLLSDKKGVFLTTGGEIGNLMMGPTLENDMNPGIFASTFSERNPRREVVEVVAAGFPKVLEPNLIMPCTLLT
jgi:hypothetical protein